jgi:hypothetical protein
MKTQGNKETDGKPIRSAEELRAFAQAYYASEFPNPEREWCPEGAILKSLVQSENLPDEEMRQHLFSCSDCFSEYRTAMAVHQKAQRLQPVSRWKFPLFDFNLNPLPGLVAAASLILLLVFGLLVNHLSQRSQPLAVVSSTTEPITGPADADLSPSTNLLANARHLPADTGLPNGVRSKLPRKPGGRRLRPLDVAVEIRIDLRDDVMRDAEAGQNGDDEFLELPTRRTSLLIELPDNSRKGLYEIKIVDPFGKPVISGTGTSRDGKTLKVSLDLRGLAAAKYRLCVARLGEAPNCYQVVINSTGLKQ